MTRWWSRIGSYAVTNVRPLSQVVALILLGAVLTALMPWPLKLIVDYVLPQEPSSSEWAGFNQLIQAISSEGLLALLAVASVFILALKGALHLLQIYVQEGVGRMMTYELGADLFDRIQRLSLRFHGTSRSGDLVKRVTKDTSCARELVLGVVVPILTALATLFAMIAIMWSMQASLTLVALIAAIPLPFLIRTMSDRLAARTYELEQAESHIMANAETALTTIPVIQAFGREKTGDEAFWTDSVRAMRAYLRSSLSQLQYKLGIDTTLAVGVAVMMVVGGLYVISGDITVGSFLVFLAYVAALYAPMETLTYVGSGFASASARARRVLEVLDSSEEVEDSPGAKELCRLVPGKSGALRLDRVTFGYEPDREVLHEIDLSVGVGETLALVGPTGAGKSTLVSLLPRFFDPWSGRVLLDGQDIRDVRLASLRAQISLVLQEPFLLPLTIAENIAYSRPDATLEEVQAAAVAARAHDFIKDLPQGYATPIGERGATLSGGQRQRLSIARALLRNAPILILDEPTSALDAETESLLLSALQSLVRGRTTIIIAHRLSTIRNADRIAFLKDGRIVEHGAHDALIKANGNYARYYDMQITRREEIDS